MAAPLAVIVDKLTAPLRRRVRLMVARAIVELVDDATKTQTLQLSVQADVLEDGVERFQQYGFTSVPLPGAEALVVHVGGDTSHGVVVAVEDRRSRPRDLAEGEAAMYTAAHGKRAYAKADGTLELGTSPTSFVALADPLGTWVQGLITVLATPVNEPGNGSPSAFEAAIAVWLAANPYPTAITATEVKAK